MQGTSLVPDFFGIAVGVLFVFALADQANWLPLQVANQTRSLSCFPTKLSRPLPSYSDLLRDPSLSGPGHGFVGSTRQGAKGGPTMAQPQRTPKTAWCLLGFPLPPRGCYEKRKPIWA